MPVSLVRYVEIEMTSQRVTAGQVQDGIHSSLVKAQEVGWIPALFTMIIMEAVLYNKICPRHPGRQVLIFLLHKVYLVPTVPQTLVLPLLPGKLSFSPNVLGENRTKISDGLTLRFSPVLHHHLAAWEYWGSVVLFLCLLFADLCLFSSSIWWVAK